MFLFYSVSCLNISKFRWFKLVIYSCFCLSLSPNLNLFEVLTSFRLLHGVKRSSFSYLIISSVFNFEIYGGESFLFVIRTRLGLFSSKGVVFV